MGTLADLKAQILDEIGDGVSVRQIGSAITRAIEQVASERFWFNQGRVTTVTVSGVDTCALPAGLRRDDLVQILVGGTYYPLVKRSKAELDDMLLGDANTGQPTDYALVGSVLQLYPTPNAVYTIAATGIYDGAALATDTSSNAWTTEGADLIVARAKVSLARDILKNADIMAAANNAVADALYRLRADTIRRVNTGKMRASA